MSVNEEQVQAKHPHDGHIARFVWLNDGEAESLYAQVVGETGDGKLWLSYAKNGSWQFTDIAVPQREIADYGDEGGGMTWHLNK